MVHYFVKEWVKFLLVRDGVPDSVVFFTFVVSTFVASTALYRWVEVPAQRSIRGLISGSPEESGAAAEHIRGKRMLAPRANP
jgi:peptidoglycan/LPS O-acetylase OafA/YrhL